MKQTLGIGKSVQHRKGGQNDGHRPAQPNPADVADLAGTIAERQQAGHHRQRTSNHRQEHTHRQPHPRHRQQLRWRHQEPQHHEDADLAQPGQRIVHARHELMVWKSPVTQHHAGHKGTEETTPARQGGQGKRGERQRHRHGRVEPERRRRKLRKRQPPYKAHQNARGRTHAQLDRDGQERHPGERRRIAEHVEHHHRKNDGHGVVDARLDFQHLADSRLKMKPAASQYAEHRGGIGRGHHGSQQKRLRPRQPNESPKDSDKQGGQPHAYRGQEAGRQERMPHRAQTRDHPAVEEDQHEVDRSGHDREMMVLEVDPADPFPTAEHPQQEE